MSVDRNLAISRRARALCFVEQLGGLANGGTIRNHHIIRAIADVADATVVVLHQTAIDDETRGEREATLTAELGCPVLIKVVPKHRRLSSMGRMLRNPFLPWQLARIDVPPLRRELVQEIHRQRPDLIWVSWSVAAWRAIPQQYRTIMVFDFIDRPTVYFAQQVRAELLRWGRLLRSVSRGRAWPVRRPALSTLIKMLDSWLRGTFVERDITRTCALVVSCSPEESPRGSSGKHRIVSNCVVDPREPLVSQRSDTSLRILLPAGFKYSPNLDGAEWFLADVLPILREQLPSCEVVLAGSHPEGLDVLATRNGATALGWVPDMAAEYAADTVVAVPLRCGSGTRIKILEAWSRGAPVISTPLGARGLGAVDGRELLLARTPEDFAAAAARLSDPQERVRVAAAGRAHFERHFSNEIVARDLLRTLDEAGMLEPRCRMVSDHG